MKPNKHLCLWPLVMLSVFTVFGCGTKPLENADENADPTEVNVYFILSLDTSVGASMSKATNSEVYSEFHEKMADGSLVAPSYSLTLTEKNTGAVSTFNGTWNNHDKITLRTGKYRVVGESIAEGEFIQDKCSLTIDQEIEISSSSTAVTLSAVFDCALLVFNKSEIKTLKNNSGTKESNFFTFNNYFYAFINYLLFDPSKADDSYIEGTFSDDALFRIYTQHLLFEKGKYYVYNSVDNVLEIPQMTEGTTTTFDSKMDNSSATIVLPPNNEIWYSSTTGTKIDLQYYPENLVSNTYTEGKGVYKFEKEITDIGNFFGSRANSKEVLANFKSITLPSSVTSITAYYAMGHLRNATTLVFPENLQAVGTDIIGSFGEDSDEIKHIYFLSSTCPSTAWRSFWNLTGTYYIHYPAGADYSAIDACMRSWTSYQKDFNWVMVETTYTISH